MAWRAEQWEKMAEAVRDGARRTVEYMAGQGVPEETVRRVVAEFVANIADARLTLSYGPYEFDRSRFLRAAGFPDPDDPAERPDPVTEAMAARYNAGATLAEVGREFEMTGTAAGDRLRAAGVPIRKGGPAKGSKRSPGNPPPDEATRRQMAARHDEGATFTEIGQEFGYHGSTVSEYVRHVRRADDAAAAAARTEDTP